MATESQAERAAVYGLLARIWQREVDTELWLAFQHEPLRTLFWQGPAGEHNLEELACDFCQLLVGPSDHLPPFQSVWGQGRLQGDASTQMRRFLEVMPAAAPDQPTDMADHLAVQLMWMGRLLHQQEIATTDAERQAADELTRAFHAAYLCWAKPLLQAVEQRAQTAFYRRAAQWTHDFLESEREYYQ